MSIHRLVYLSVLLVSITLFGSTLSSATEVTVSFTARQFGHIVQPLGSEAEYIHDISPSDFDLKTALNTDTIESVSSLGLKNPGTEGWSAGGVNMGLIAENLCNCYVPAYQQNTLTYYYRLYSNSNLQLCKNSDHTDCGGWDNFSNLVQAETGYIHFVYQ